MRGNWHRRTSKQTEQERKQEELEPRTQGLIAYQEKGEKGVDEFLDERWAKKRAQAREADQGEN